MQITLVGRAHNLTFVESANGCRSAVFDLFIKRGGPDPSALDFTATCLLAAGPGHDSMMETFDRIDEGALVGIIGHACKTHFTLAVVLDRLELLGAPVAEPVAASA